MKHKAQQQIQRWQWTLRYRFAAMNPTAKLLLLGCLVAQALLLSSLLAYEQRATELQRSLLQASNETPVEGHSAEASQRALVERFQAFLPPASEVENIGAALHKAAETAGINIDKLSSQPGDKQATAYQRHNFRLQLHGDKDKVERFILLALLDNDALLLRRWAFQATEAQATSASSTLDFELLVKPQ